MGLPLGCIGGFLERVTATLSVSSQVWPCVACRYAAPESSSLLGLLVRSLPGSCRFLDTQNLVSCDAEVHWVSGRKECDLTEKPLHTSCGRDCVMWCFQLFPFINCKRRRDEQQDKGYVPLQLRTGVGSARVELARWLSARVMWSVHNLDDLCTSQKNNKRSQEEAKRSG